jgi:hypothetical protein
MAELINIRFKPTNGKILAFGLTSQIAMEDEGTVQVDDTSLPVDFVAWACAGKYKIDIHNGNAIIEVLDWVEPQPVSIIPTHPEE